MANQTIQYRDKQGNIQTTIESSRPVRGNHGIVPNVLNSANLTPTPLITPVTPPPPTQGIGLQGTIETQAKQYADTVSDPKNLEALRTNRDLTYDALVGEIMKPGESTLSASEYETQGVNKSRKELDDINNQILSEQNSLRKRLEVLDKNPQGLFGGALESEKARVTKESTSKQADLSIIQMARQNNYYGAKEIADRKVAAQVELEKSKIQALQLTYENNKDLFSKEEQKQFETEQSERNRLLGKKEDELKNVNTLAMKALQNGAPTDVVKSMLQAETQTEAIGLGGDYLVDAGTGFTLGPGETRYDSHGNVVAVGGSGMGQGQQAVDDLNTYAARLASSGTLPSPAELKLSGLTVGQVAEAAKVMPKFEGTVVDINTGVKSTAASPAVQEDFSRLYNIVKLTDKLKELDDNRIHGAVSGTLGKVFGSNAQAEYLTTRKAIVDEIQRMQSGAALTEEETAFYGDYLPGRFSQTLGLGQDSGKKIENFKKVMEEKLQNRLANNSLSIYGYTTVKVGDKDFHVGDIIDNGTGQQGRVNPDGSISPIGNATDTSGDVSMNRPTRNNNPLNIKSSNFTQAFPGVAGVDPSPASDGGQFLTFVSPEAGFNAAKKLITSTNYKNLTVDSALKRWSNSGYGGELVPSIKGKKISELTTTELNNLLNAMARREGYQSVG